MARRSLLKQSGAPKEVQRELQRRIGRMMLVNRRKVLATRAQLLLHSWKKVHVPFSIIMALIASVHIWLAF
ncbi:MAG: hypothetical protein JKY56_23480 [Kofleriaceae bacterium]|nr:hypothetical protein [Kofleriaceae bacterium]